jgi:hypothetical protein
MHYRNTRKIKAIFSTILVVGLLATLLSVPAFAEDADSVFVSGASGSPGSEIILDVAIISAGDFDTAAYRILYDKGSFEFVETDNPYATVTNNNRDNRTDFQYFNKSELFSIGTYSVKYTFLIKNTAEPNEYDFTAWVTGLNGGSRGQYNPDITHTATITVTGEGSGGDPEPATPTLLSAPVLSAVPGAKTSDSITLAAPAASAQEAAAAVQYRSKLTSGSEWGEWQISPTFSGLSSETSYGFQAMYVAVDTESWIDSEPGAAVTIVTDAEAAPPTPPPGPVYSYTVSPVAASGAVALSDTFEIKVVVTADDPAAEFAAVDATLGYNSAKVQFVGATFAWTTGEALISGRIAGYGDSQVVGNGVAVATYTFKAEEAGDAVFTINGAKIGQTGNTADFDATGGSVTVNIEAPAAAEPGLIARDLFKSAPEGYQLLKYLADTLPEAGNAYYYGDETSPLYYAGQSGSQYVFVGFVPDSVTAGSIGAVTAKAGSYETIAYDGDVNGNAETNAIDALIVHDIAGGSTVYAADTAFDVLSALDRLESDFNNDGKVDAADARAILYASLGTNDPGQ